MVYCLYYTKLCAQRKEYAERKKQDAKSMDAAEAERENSVQPPKRKKKKVEETHQQRKSTRNTKGRTVGKEKESRSDV